MTSLVERALRGGVGWLVVGGWVAAIFYGITANREVWIYIGILGLVVSFIIGCLLVVRYKIVKIPKSSEESQN